MRESLYRSTNRPKPLKIRGEKILYSIAVGILITVMGIYISSRQAESLEMGYHLEELNEQVNQLRDERRILKSELAFLKDPQRVLSKMNAMNLQPMRQQYWVYQSKAEPTIQDEAALLE